MRMFWSKLCKSSWNCAWNLAFPVFISPIVWNMCENLHYESVYFKDLHNQQECYWPTIYRTGAALVSTITSYDSYILLVFFVGNRYPRWAPFSQGYTRPFLSRCSSWHKWVLNICSGLPSEIFSALHHHIYWRFIRSSWLSRRDGYSPRECCCTRVTVYPGVQGWCDSKGPFLKKVLS